MRIFEAQGHQRVPPLLAFAVDVDFAVNQQVDNVNQIIVSIVTTNHR